MSNIGLFQDLNQKIREINEVDGNINIMEVCGTHTMAISKYGLRNLLNKNINLVSGPGCPVCVTPSIYLDYIYELALKKEFVITTYGDMIRVPGSSPDKTLEKAKALGADVRIVYSSMDALKLAENNKSRKVIFLGIGFETTTPSTAVAIEEAYRKGLNNFFVLSIHKIVEPAVRLLMSDKSLKIHGFLLPGHVAAVIGEQGFEFLKEYGCPGVITGFNLEDIVQSIYSLIYSIKNQEFLMDNQYKRLVKKEGNVKAKSIVEEVFELKDDYWRGIGLIPKSGLAIKEKYKAFNIESIYPLPEFKEEVKNGCMCGDVIKGKIKPDKCALFGKVCMPENPIGPCMVSSEGSCAAYYKYSNL